MIKYLAVAGPHISVKADEIAKVISNKLELNHTAEEWLNALDKMF